MAIKEYIKKTTTKVKDEANSAVNYVKVSYKQKQVNDALNYLYKKLGEVRYEELNLNEGITEQSMKIYEQISQLKEEAIQLAKEKKTEKKNDSTEHEQPENDEQKTENDKTKCKNCRKKLPKDISFCPYCGEKCD